MKNLVTAAISSALAMTVISGHAGITGGGTAAVSREEPRLLIVGPVESVDVRHGIATILGQMVVAANVEQLSIGDTAVVFGKRQLSGLVAASQIRSQGLYVAGATSIYLLGSIQKSDASVGKITVEGLSIDLTPIMADGL